MLAAERKSGDTNNPHPPRARVLAADDRNARISDKAIRGLPVAKFSHRDFALSLISADFG